MDEAGISTVPNKTPKVLTPKGKKTVCKISSGSKYSLPGTLNLVTETGYMNSDLFLEWLKHFVHHTKPSHDDPVLLVADHSSHCSVSAVLYLRKHHETFLTLPPHASHVIQPLDKVFFGPLMQLKQRNGLCSTPERSYNLLM